MCPRETSGVLLLLLLITAGGMLGLIWARCAPPRGADNQLPSIAGSERYIHFSEGYVKQLGLENDDALPRAAV